MRDEVKEDLETAGGRSGLAASRSEGLVVELIRPQASAQGLVQQRKRCANDAGVLSNLSDLIGEL